MTKSRRAIACGLIALLAACGVADANPPENEFLAMAWAQEEALAQCMSNKGFEYIPFVDPLEDEGFGAPTSPAEGPALNPNDAILVGLTEVEQEAYAAAFWGPESATYGDLDPANGGCASQATFEVFGEPPDLSEVGEELADIDSAVALDRRVVEAEEQWAQCMRKGGFEASTRATLYNEIDALELSLAQQAVDLGLSELSNLPNWEALSADIEAMLSADESCSVDYKRVHDEVHAEYLESFFDDHPDLFGPARSAP